MVQPVLKWLPRNCNLKPVLEIVNEKLKGKVLAVKAFTCDAYALIVRRRRDQSATIGIVTSNQPLHLLRSQRLHSQQTRKSFRPDS